MVEEVGQIDRMKVFVSYSRADVAFADQLVAGLEHSGFDAILDRHDIDAAENWKARLGGLIISCDAVAFVLTEKSAGSSICAWEVDEAKKLGKRIIPCVPAEVSVAPPPALADLNWIHFYSTSAIPGSGMFDGLRKLDRALRVDLAWLREQTRHSERASEWTLEPAEDRLLRGQALKEAQDWLGRAPAGAGIPVSVREYLTASADAEQAREAAAKAQLEEKQTALDAAQAAVASERKALAERAKTATRLRWVSISALAAGAVLLALAGWGAWYASERTVETAERDAALFARQANETTATGDASKAMLVALSGDPAALKGPLEHFFRPNGYATAREALARADYANRMIWRAATGEPVSTLASFRDGLHFASFHEQGIVRFWSVDENEPTRTIQLAHDAQGWVPVVREAHVLPDGERALLLWVDGTLTLTSLKDGSELKAFGVDNSQRFTSAALDSSGTRALAANKYNIELWPVEGSTKPIQQWTVGSSGNSDSIEALTFSQDGGGFYSSCYDVSSARWSVCAWEFGKSKPIEMKSLGYEARPLTFYVGGSSGSMLVGAEDGLVYRLDRYDLSVYESFDPCPSLTSRGGLRQILAASDGAVEYYVWDRDMACDWRRVNKKGSNDFGSGRTTHALTLLQDGGMAVVGSPDGTITMWAMKRGTTLQEVGSGDLARAQANQTTILGGKIVFWGVDKTKFASLEGAEKISPDGEYILRKVAAATSDKGREEPLEEVIVRRSDNAIVQRIPAGSSVSSFLPGGNLFIRKGRGNETTLSVWKVGAGSPAWETAWPHGSFMEAMSADGTRLLIESVEDIRVWTNGRLEAHVKPGEFALPVFAPDGEHFALGLRSGGIQLWRVGEESPTQIFEGHSDGISAIAFSKDGTLMVSGALDGTAMVWRVGEKEALQELDSVGRILDVAFAPDSKHVLVAADGGVHEFETTYTDPSDARGQVERACRRLLETGMDQFTSQDILDMPILKGLPLNPCVAMGPVSAKGRDLIKPGSPGTANDRPN